MPPARAPRGRLSELGWALATPLVVLVAACIPLLGTRDFYFRDDTENGAFPIWYRLGQLLRAGEWPLLEPSSWMAGNIAAEGQWGLWSPLTLGVSLLAGTTTSAVAFSTAVKLVLLMTAALGGFVLVRSYAVRPSLAFAIGVALPLNGFTLYMQAPSWVTGLMTWALVPWAWAALRRCTHKKASPLPFLVLAYLIVTVGYFHGFMALGMVLIAVGVDRVVEQDWRSVRTVVLGGAFCLLLAATVYLPGILSAEVTNRSNDTILNSGWLGGDLTSLLTSASPTGMYRIRAWWGLYTPVPLLYLAWFLPVLALVARASIRPALREMRDVVILGTAAVLVVLGPSDLGPLRFPTRVMPYVTLAVLVALAVLLDRSLPARPSRKALGWALGWVAVACYLGYSQRPEQYGGITLLTVTASGAGIALVWLVLRRSGTWRTPRVAATVAVVLAAGCVATTLAQARLFPTSPLAHFDMPGQISDYQTQLDGAVNDVLVIGAPTDGLDEAPISRFDNEYRPPRPPDSTFVWEEVLVGNSWLINQASVQNVYSVIQHRKYADVVCMNFRGETCPELLERLFRLQPGLFVPLVDVLSIDTLHILKADVPDAEDGPPAGWSVVDEGLETVTWTRDAPVGPAGGVVWTSQGTSTTTLARSDRSVTLRVDDVPAGGGRVVLSRLAWPGYSVENAELAEPVNDYLLGVDLPAGSSGEVVELSFSPPGWVAGQATWLTALLLAAGWSAVHLWHSRRRRRGAPATG